VLKAEEDEMLLEALRESLEEIEHDLLLELVTDMRQEQEDISFYARNSFLGGLFNGYIGLSQLDENLSGSISSRSCSRSFGSWNTI